MSLLDRLRKQPAPPQAPAGFSGRNHYGGFLDLEELNADLQGQQGLRIFDRMWRTDGDCRRSLAMVCNPVIGGTWSLEPFGGDDATDLDKQIAEDIRWALFEFMSPNLAEHLAEAVPLFARSGFAPFEQIWQPVERNGKTLLMPFKLDVRLPRSIWRWHEDRFGNLVAIDQLLTGSAYVVRDGANNNGDGTARIEADNLVYYRVGQEGDNWEGTSLLRPAYKHWYIKDNVERLDAIAQEREATGIPVIYPPANVSDPGVLAEVEERVAGLRAGEEAVIVMPGPKQSGTDDAQGWLLEIIGLGGGGSGSRSAESTLNYHSDKIAAAVVAEFMRLGQKNVGAKATGDVQQDPFYAGVEAIAGIPERALQPLINRITALNWKEAKGAPTLSMEKADSTSIGELQTYVSGLAGSGALTVDDPLEDFLRMRADLPPADPTVRAAKHEQQKAQKAAELEQAKNAANPQQPPGAKGSQKLVETTQPGQDGKPQKSVVKETVKHFDAVDVFSIEPAESIGHDDWAYIRTFDAKEVPNRPGKTNWVERAGGLPKKIADLAGDLITERAKDTSSAIAIAVGAAKRFCAQGKSDWCAAVAEWERKKATHSFAHDDPIGACDTCDAETYYGLCPNCDNETYAYRPLEARDDHGRWTDGGIPSAVEDGQVIDASVWVRRAAAAVKTRNEGGPSIPPAGYKFAKSVVAKDGATVATYRKGLAHTIVRVRLGDGRVGEGPTEQAARSAAESKA